MNNDTIVTKPPADGRRARADGRAHRPTSPDPNLDWTLTDTADAKAGLRSGEYYAVLTIPSDFSAAILSSGGDKPSAGS